MEVILRRILLITLTMNLAAIAANLEWPMFRQGCLQQGRQDGNSNLVTDIVRWQVNIGAGVNGGVLVSELTQDGIVDIIVISDPGTLYVFNGLTGALEWSFGTGASMKSTPAIGDGNGDGLPEIVFGSYDKFLYLLSVMVSSSGHGTCRQK